MKRDANMLRHDLPCYEAFAVHSCILNSYEAYTGPSRVLRWRVVGNVQQCKDGRRILWRHEDFWCDRPWDGREIFGRKYWIRNGVRFQHDSQIDWAIWSEEFQACLYTSCWSCLFCCKHGLVARSRGVVVSNLGGHTFMAHPVHTPGYRICVTQNDSPDPLSTYVRFEDGYLTGISDYRLDV